LQGADVVTEIVNGGMLGENKGINLPGVAIKVPSLTEKDERTWSLRLKAGATRWRSRLCRRLRMCAM
jgi:pyruvate kinase